MASLTLDELTKVYQDGTLAVDRLSLAVRQGELLVLLGPSGCGKSTALRMIAGLEDISSGQLRIGDRLANYLAPQERDIAMVFQNFALYPHLSVRQNLAFGLNMAGEAQPAVAQRVGEVAAMLGLDNQLNRWPGQLSGGERQRVAMGRAIVRDPEVFLMDEPLSNLDAQLRVHLRAELSTLIRGMGTTTVYVTHDQNEAMSMGDRVAIMRRGVLQQVGTPHEVYDRPANVFVASFIGTPRMNLLRAVVDARRDGAVELRLASQSLAFLPPLTPDQALLRGYHGQSVVVGLRPEAIGLTPDDPFDTRHWQKLHGVIQHVEFLGHETLVHLDTGSQREAVPHLEPPVEHPGLRRRRLGFLRGPAVSSHRAHAGGRGAQGQSEASRPYGAQLNGSGAMDGAGLDGAGLEGGGLNGGGPGGADLNGGDVDGAGRHDGGPGGSGLVGLRRRLGLSADRPGRPPISAGTVTGAGGAAGNGPEDGHTSPGDLVARLQVPPSLRIGSRATFTVDMTRLFVFDQTGRLATPLDLPA